MSIIYDPSNINFTQTLYVVEATGDQFFQPTVGQGDNADSGTMAERLAQCERLNPNGVEEVA